MFLHLGEEVIVPKKSIIGIFDKEKCINSIITREFIEICYSEKKIHKIGDEEKIKTFILTNEGVYLSPISSMTLLKRFEKLIEIITEE
ncbi:MAG: extracellular matrix regulator RemB [Peptococcaceae bacterium]